MAETDNITPIATSESIAVIFENMVETGDWLKLRIVGLQGYLQTLATNASADLGTKAENIKTHVTTKVAEVLAAAPLVFDVEAAVVSSDPLQFLAIITKDGEHSTSHFVQVYDVDGNIVSHVATNAANQGVLVELDASAIGGKVFIVKAGLGTAGDPEAIKTVLISF